MINKNEVVSDFAIVVIAYNRLDSLRRLIGSLYGANYCGDKVDLIVSIDNSGSHLLVEYAQSLLWPHGKIKVIAHEERLGLKRHVLKCGELTNTYKNLCVLEDDLYVSPAFYVFSKAAIEHFKNNKDVAGISLYSHQWNPYTNRPFGAIEDKSDVFLLQIASSWGQIWNREWWNDFMVWMNDKTDDDLHSHLLPWAVSNWSAKSWLKFHNKYLVDTGKYFVYPRKSLTTNFSDQGEHAVENTTYQVPLLLDTTASYDFPSNAELAMKYDAFFENKKIAEYLGMSDVDLDVNLYGARLNTKRYILTTEVLDFKIIRSFGLKVRPVDANVLLQIPGDEIYLYDTFQPEKNEASIYLNGVKRFLYDIKAETKKEFLLASIYLYINSLLRRLRLIWS